MKIRAIAFMAAATIMTAGCAAPRTTIVQTLGPTDARLRVGATRLVVGDRIAAHRVWCAPVRRSRSICFREHHGQGIVTRVEGDVAFAHFPLGGRFAPRDRVTRR